MSNRTRILRVAGAGRSRTRSSSASSDRSRSSMPTAGYCSEASCFGPSLRPCSSMRESSVPPIS
jgi:hypothetical protein